MRKIAILGSTGSIGTQALEVVDEFPDKFEVKIITGHRNKELLLKQALKYKPEFVIATAKESFEFLQKELKLSGTKIVFGLSSFKESLEQCEVDLVLGAITGAAGISPVLTSLRLGIDVALANKESIVAAGSLVKKIQKESSARIIPVDSEHSAIFQCLEEKNDFSKIIITASGGPFFKCSLEELERVSPEKALKHPNWDMGNKVTIDSATLMNKGLEVIEAHWLFDAPYDLIEPIIHPQSIVHSLVEYPDGSVIAQLGVPDMKVPIQYAFTYPERWKNSFKKLSLLENNKLEFYRPDLEKFPCLGLAFKAGKIGYSMPIVLNAANEIAVKLFLEEKIRFQEIAILIDAVMSKHSLVKDFDEEELFEIDSWARKKALDLKI